MKSNQLKHQWMRMLMIAMMLLCILPSAWADPITPSDFTATELSPGVVKIRVPYRKFDASATTFGSNVGAYSLLGGNRAHSESARVYFVHNGENKVIINLSEGSYRPNDLSNDSIVISLWYGCEDSRDTLHLGYVRPVMSWARETGRHGIWHNFNVCSRYAENKYTYVEYEWHMPEYLAAQGPVKVYFRGGTSVLNPVNAARTSSTDLQLELGSFTAPESDATVPTLQTVQMAMPDGSRESQPGKMMLLYSGETGVRYTQLIEQGSPLGTKTYHSGPGYSGFCYFPISDQVRTIQMDAYLDYNRDSLLVFKTPMRTGSITVPAYHQIHDLQATWHVDKDGLRNGDVSLTWSIYHQFDEDIMETDMFVIERATKADFSDAVQIKIIEYQKDSAFYEYIDSSDEVKRQDAEGSTLYYRVRRASASVWSDMDAVIQAGLGATTKLYYGVRNSDDIENELHVNFRSLRPFHYEVETVSGFSWADEAKRTFNINVELKSNGMKNEVKPQELFFRPDEGVWQPTVGSSLAMPASDWATSRQVKISANVTAGGKIRGVSGGPDDWYRSGPYHVTEIEAFDYNNGPLQCYWDKERTLLFLVRRMITGTDTVDMEIPVPADSIQYNKDRRYYEIRMSDVADQPCTRYEYYFRVDASNNPLPLRGNPVSPIAEAPHQFYFNDGMRLDSVWATMKESPDFVSLRWSTTGGEFEQYEVWRTADTANMIQWQKVATVQAMSYLDRKAPIGVPCKYKVVGLLNCDGSLVDTSMVVSGQRDCYGNVSGHVSFPNGVSCPGLPIQVYNQQSEVVGETLTDSLGYFYVDSLWFNEEARIYYVAVADSEHVYKTYAGGDMPYAVSLNGTTAIIRDVNIINTSYVRFEGRVLYEHSTVPVPHVQFYLNDRLLTDVNGHPYETDASGNFDLMVESGTTTIRAYKEGHTFANDSYFVDENGNREFHLTENQYGKRLHDLTKVRVAGRVTGGLTEGTKPLGLGQSVNTLGDSITLVLELEGDNTSRFVYYPTHSEITEINETFHHLHTGDSTNMTTTAKRITVYPDVRTGEFVIELFPARYKVTQAYAKGYATLFAGGMTSQSIDLSDVMHIEGYMDTLIHNADHTVTPIHQPYNYRYQITYRNPVKLRYQQLVYGMPKDYLGEEKMKYENVLSKDTTISLLMRDSQKQLTGYVFGYPVFNSQPMRNKYTFRISATEDYYYNADESSSRHWQEYITGRKVTLFNGMNTANEAHHVYIDPVTRYATCEVEVNNPSFVLTGESGLRQIEVGMEMNGLYIYGEPIRGYITGSRAKGVETLQALNDELTILDFIRDPYGANSYAYVEAGTSYQANYHMDWDITAGLGINISTGPDIYQSLGTVAAPMGVGAYTGTVMLNQTTTINSDIPIQLRFAGYKDANYTFTTSERIQTSSDPTMVGAMADIYVGTMHHTYAGMLDAVTIIDSTQYRMLQPAIRSGKVHLLSVPQDSTPYYLVVGEQTELGKTRPVEFIYTQKHILNNVLPRLLQLRDALLMNGSESELQAVADSLGKPVYRNLVEPEDDLYGVEGGYHWITPTQQGIYVDDVKRYNNLIMQWVKLIAQNEKEKAEVIRKANMPNMLSILGIETIDTYSVTSGAEISYSETTEYSHGSDWHWRYMTSLTGAGAGVGGIIGSIAGDAFSTIYHLVQKLRGKDIDTKTKILGYEIGFGFKMIFDDNIHSGGTVSFGNRKTAGYVLSTSAGSYEDIAVYRLTDDYYNKINEDTRKDALSDISSSQQYGNQPYADFIFHRLGGASRCPYEGEETTLFYTQGNQPIQLASPTLHIDRPTLSINVREISNVPTDQPATFVLTISNETDLTYDPQLVPASYTLWEDDDTNTKGLIILMDGQPVRNGLGFALLPGESIQKTIQVYKGTDYDYENVGLTLMSDCDRTQQASVQFTVRFQPVSCPVSLTLPVQNWVLNTLSPKDGVGYYLPVEISGFDVNYDNFDHIDLQYKLHTEADDRWTTQCSYYADSSLYALASGNKAMIENGLIRNVHFYGERDPMEQHYDLRAVSYCRLGNEFLTRSSELKSGLKDTRVPQLFGAATPTNGILGVGDYISIPFSEDIAANYLDEDYNFEVIGYTNHSKANGSTALCFRGAAEETAETMAAHNLNDKDFSISMMVRPSDAKREMTYLMQGNQDTYIGFGQAYYPNENQAHLGVHMANQSEHSYFISRPIEIDTAQWMHVVATYSSADGLMEIYMNGELISEGLVGDKPQYVRHYAGVGPIKLGSHLAYPETAFAGSMMHVSLWNKVLTPVEVRTIQGRQLTGYESSLIAYYPLNEGHSTQAGDKTGGSNMQLSSLKWSHPDGKSLHLRNQNGQRDTLHLNGSFFPSSIQQDFSYTMWFRTADHSDTLSLLDSYGVKLLLTDFGLTMREPDMEDIVCDGSWTDGYWHHLAVTVNHSMGAGALYVDGKKVGQFGADKAIGPNDTEVRVGPLEGDIDDITYWEMALPADYLLRFYHHTPNNREMGLITHLSFSDRVLNESGDSYHTIYCPLNDKIRLDNNGNVQPRTEADRVVINPDSLLVITDENAPVNEKGDLVKLGFNWIGRNNELVINLKPADKEINKQNIFVTVRNVEDLAGNPQASPLSWMLFVDRNQLRWSEKYLQATVCQGEGEILQVDLLNQGGSTANYYVDQLPWWLSVSSNRGELSPLEQRPMPLRISDKLDPGEYSAVIYLTDDNELSEPLRIDVTVKAETPDWKTDPSKSNGQTMNVFATVQIVGAQGVPYYDTDTADIVGAFLGNVCIGTQHLVIDDEQSLLCMSLQGSNDSQFQKAVTEHQAIRFLLWHATSGKIYALNPVDSTLHICYEPDTWVGSADQPVLLRTTEYRHQHIALSEGWNWISFYIDPDRSGRNFADALTGDYHFHDGDFIKWGSVSQSFEQGEWHGMPMQFYNKYIYMVRVGQAGRLGVQGFTATDAQRTISLKKGWNHMPYVCESTQEINKAMSHYSAAASPGDLIKGYHSFAMLNSSNRWVGSLQYLQPGEGYLLYRQDSTAAVMELYVEDMDTSEPYKSAQAKNQQALSARHSHNMPIVATVSGVAEGDMLLAYEGNELVGVAEADAEGRFMLMTSANEQSRLSFRYLSAQGEQMTAPIITYQSQLSSIGTVDHPYLITFGTDMAAAYPDPFTDHITYAGVVAEQGQVEMILYNVGGHCVWQHTIDVQAGPWQYTQTNTESYPQGLYVAVIRVNGNTTQVKLIKE